ncbi:AAA family ATPase [Vibrio tubiashii]|uniref:Type II secretion protein n=2 Tax=Vibrio tubiashii ATCC 19109 TaxID=1051646 RepID=A0A0A0SPG2_9VIBR|nr:AAA family ATPase [Vibrio tubiashii]AIW16204.1 type II secretion protein [Vibrio tubiashii ATCC 19109]EIF04831.1 Flp pilus assembly protein TadZ [Vibrio tubiashii NCIMB 1337 = ATCC 19106]
MDLDILFKNSSSKMKESISARDLIVSDDAAFIESVNDLYAIEGYAKPIEVPDIDNDSAWNNSDVKLNHVILDLRGAGNVVDQTSEIATRLDVSISLLVLCDVDSIKLRNQVHSLGANYVLWDAELDALLAAIKSNEEQESSVKRTRVAKRILILGTKGGVGVSSVSSLLCHSLAGQANLKTLLVDHDSGAMNSDIYLGVKGLKAKQNSIDLNQIDIDDAIAKTYVHPVVDKLDYLVLEKNIACLSDHATTLFNLSNQLIDQYNFIIDSAPLSCYEEIHDQELSEKYHRIFVVCDPSVSSLRSYNLLKKKLGKVEHELVFNLNRPAKDFMVTLASAKERIRVKTSIDFAYEPALEKLLIQQGIGHFMKSKSSAPIANMVSTLTGKKIKTKPRFSLFRK